MTVPQEAMRIAKIQSLQGGRGAGITLVAESGRGSLRLEFLHGLEDIPAQLAKRRCPLGFQMTAAILAAVGLEIAYIQIAQAEEGVAMGILGVRSSAGIKEVTVRPSEAVILSACVGGCRILADPELLEHGAPEAANT